MTQTEVPPVLRWAHIRLTNIWVTLKGNREALVSGINDFIKTTLYEAIELINKDKSESKKKKTINRYNNRIGHHSKKRKSRNAKKKYSYARCQELFLENPKRLTDAIVNNNQAFLQSAREPPEAAEVRRLYEDLWG